MIYKTENGYVASSNGVWITGCFECKRTANYAFRFNDEQLQKLQKEKNKTNGIITYNDLKELRNQLKLKK